MNSNGYKQKLAIKRSPVHMAEVTAPPHLNAAFAALLRSTKADFVRSGGDGVQVSQHGAAALDAANFPGWPTGLTSAEPIIETYLGSDAEVVALSDNEPFVSSWQPLAEWMNTTVRRQLLDHDVALDGDAYITASLSATAALEGLAHMDDDTFTPDETVSVVAIIGELAGPRVALGSLPHGPLRAMSQVTFSESQLERFAADEFDHCRGEPDQLIMFPQFGQLHAGPATHHVEHLSPTRQLLVMRAAVSRDARG